jgi:short-subunit dehydrogenase
MAQTALITGASSGIGLELARIFAAHQTDLLLIARSGDKLQELASTLIHQHGIAVKWLAADLSKPDAALTVFNFCRESGLHIDYLINNAGFGDYGPFAGSNWEKQDSMIRLNITTLTHLTRLFLPFMIKARSGRILNVASTAAFQPGPMMAVYFATKAYVLHFSEAIANELSGTGITVTALCPGITESGFVAAAEMGQSRLAKRKMPTSAEVARYGYKAMMRGKTVAVHGTLNYLMANAGRFVPRNLVTRMARLVAG